MRSSDSTPNNEVYIDGVATIDGEPVLSHEPVIHPGGSQAVDYNKVSHVGVHTVVQVISTQKMFINTLSK